MSQLITIIVGTMTGTAEIVAEDIQAALEDDGHVVEQVAMDGLDAGVFRRPGVFLVCTSTYGQGDVPDNAKALFGALDTQRPDLSGVAYGVIGLGDSTYADTFCEGGRRFDRLLARLNAYRVGQPLEHDAGGDELPEEAGVAWARAWVGLLADTRAAA